MQGLESLDKFKSFVSDIGGLGRYEDTYMVHAAEGETVIPMEVLDKNPVLRERLFETMRYMGIQPERYVVGNEFNSINPLTGQPEFFLKKVFRRLRKAKQDIGRRLRKFAADSSGYVAPIVGAMYGPLAGSLAGGLLGQYKRENPGDKNQALKMAIRGGISGLTSNLAQGQNILTGRGMSEAAGTLDPLAIGRKQLERFGIGNQQTANVNVPSNVQTVNYNPNTFTSEADAIRSAGGDLDYLKNNNFRVMDAGYSGPNLNTGILADATTNVTDALPFPDLPKEGFLESLQYGGSKAYLNPLNILKNPGPNEVKELFAFKNLRNQGFSEADAMSKVMSMFQLTPAKASAIAGAVTYGTQLVMDRMGGGDDDDDDGSSAGYEINPILEGIFSGGSSGDIYYDYPDAIQAAEGGIMDLQNGGESTGPGTGTSDSIPAMLSDGEFVMTAKAVRGAGGGDRREGARRMYEMMDNLERTA